MATADLEWLAEQIQVKLEQMRTKTDRDRELIHRSFEAVAKAKQLLSKPIPNFWPSRE